MREILFRGKRIDTGEWVEGSYVLARNIVSEKIGHLIVKIGTDMVRGELFDFEIVDPSTVGQYTGLTDKNGKKIFEGDILECIFLKRPYRDVVVYGRWNCSCCDGVYGYALSHEDERLDFRKVESYEIIGNIYDSPELLEDKQ